MAVVAVLLVAFLAGCSGKSPGSEQLVGGLAYPRGTDPWPQGDGSEWPAGLAGPFKLGAVENVKIASFDGILLDAWVIRPDVPAGTKLPTVLWSAPYFGLNNRAGNDPTGWDNDGPADAVPVNVLIEQGYAVAILNLRGSGNSQGCYQLFGSIDWKDNAAAVEWLGTQEWSNGRVGMMGLSYHGTTPWMAAVEAPPHLKTIITAGMIHNLYTFFHTPQGAHLTIGPAFSTEVNAIDMAPPLLASPEELASEWPGTLSTKLCPELVPVATEAYKSGYTDLRDEAFWEDRGMLSHYGAIRSSVFLTMGLLDYHGSGHAYQEDYAWANLPAGTPARMLVGQWEHMFPNFSERYTSTGRDWNAELLPWLDFWLKGVGDPPKVGLVEYQDSEDAWHNTTAWPPPEGTPVSLHLGGGTLASAPPAGTATFRGHSTDEFSTAACEPAVPGQPPASVLYQTEPLEDEVLLAGNPFAKLRLTSDLPGGQLSAVLIAIEEGGLGCGGALGEGQAGFRFLGMGAADLRHHAGNYVGSNFPVGTPTDVRIDINNFAEVLGVGERLGLLLCFGDATVDGPNPYSPTLTIDEAGSQVVVQLVTGTLDSAIPDTSYPPRPFDPMGGD